MRALTLALAPLWLAALAVGCSRASVDGPTSPPEDAPALEDNHLIAEDGYRLPYRRWGPERDASPEAVVLALHGLNDYSRGMRFAAEHLAEGGIATYAYDHRGFGDTADAGTWPGGQALVDDAATAVERLAERYPDTPLYLMGHSMGGAIAMILATEQSPEAVSGSALLAPAVWGREAMPWYQRTGLWLSSRLTPGLRLSGEDLGVDPTDNPEVLEEWHDDPLIQREVSARALAGVTDLMDRALEASEELEAPTLILYGEQDEVIPREPTCLMLHRLPERPPGQWRLVLYPDGHHLLTRDLQRERVHADLLAWFLDPEGARLPSSHEVGHQEGLSRLCGDRD
ncbi:alpha/beta hydrolase [Halorhodospira halophila]|uniref:Alpha/beta hydrolase fold protein n=1 Tax=Halorhodospira halophila (strain DSM 244 / SL1) TaxID=349124 RepID=A1WXL6_HALHL|nr:alpha/beta hydrolase [Halorhodospira halophila]ABM62428.1 alpha/beta hydrolase fold protein [Halorhodospira halophila SL1]MBK1729557.1 alpha/beta hydrolase [Halorhodospira halophila]